MKEINEDAVAEELVQNNTKRTITVVADENLSKEELNFLKNSYDLKIIDDKVFLEKLVDEDLETPIVDMIIVNKDFTMDVLKYIFRGFRYGKIPVLLAFGQNSINLGKMNNCLELVDITNHSETKHSNTFINGNNYYECNVSSNHTSLLLPKSTANYDVLSYSTYNISEFYNLKSKNLTFKKKRNFFELEGIYFPTRNSYCFLYEVPSKNETLLIDLTLQSINL